MILINQVANDQFIFDFKANITECLNSRNTIHNLEVLNIESIIGLEYQIDHVESNRDRIVLFRIIGGAQILQRTAHGTTGNLYNFSISRPLIFNYSSNADKYLLQNTEDLIIICPA